MAATLVFYFLATVTTVGAISVVALPNPMYCVFSLIVTFLGLAGLFLSLNAQFVAIVQIIVYASAIMMLFLFVIMLINLDKEEKKDLKIPFQKLLGIVFGLFVFLVLIIVLKDMNISSQIKGVFTPQYIDKVGNTQLIGQLLLSKYLLPFQTMGVLLFVGIIGAVVLGRKKSR